MRQSVIEKNLKQTEIGYNLIATKFSQTRKHFWRSLEFIKDYTQNGDRVLDFGCGNGRLTELFKNKNVYYRGVDVSEKLINLAKEQYSGSANNFLKISPNEVRLPFNDKNFNSIYSIATFHHLPSKSHRLAMARELYRLTKNEGWIIVTVWDLWQTKYRKQIIKNRLSKLIGKSKLDWNDCQITFTNNEGKIFNRYHHAFTERDLEKLFRKAGFNIISVQKIKGNIVLVGQK